ncbi:MAG: hypothetical protein LUQ65_12790 [Candidatus Helarchaeota archaeon]|nr:hypothetical protein [Candidatus Helarchaeota archaeon]
MEGRIYISSAFTNLRYVKCRPNRDRLDNDPHFWNFPPTWGICRTDFRRMIGQGDYIFFVLPKHTNLPQMIYGYFKIREHIDHITAYRRFPKKRMRNGNPNGNIIVNADGSYNRFDNGAHRDRFDEIKKHYIVSDPKHFRFLKPADINRLAPSFLETLNTVFKSNATDIFEVIGRKGRVLRDTQVSKLVNWLNN